MGGEQLSQYVADPVNWVDVLGLHGNKCKSLSEDEYKRRIEMLERKYGSSNVHSLEKHGAQTSAISQYRRVKDASYPNPSTGAPGAPTKKASKFLTNKDHYQALRKGILENKRTGSRDVEVSFDRDVGLSVENLGTHRQRGPFSAQYVKNARVRFDNDGKFYTAFPEV
jgi:hypothetical protein